jgi:hypothetical protein
MAEKLMINEIKEEALDAIAYFAQYDRELKSDMILTDVTAELDNVPFLDRYGNERTYHGYTSLTQMELSTGTKGIVTTTYGGRSICWVNDFPVR